MVSSWKLNVPKLGVIEFKKVYGTLGQKVYASPPSKYEKIYYCPLHRKQVMEGRMVGFCEDCNTYYPLKKGGDGVKPGPGEPGGLIVKIKDKTDVHTDSGDFEINAKVVSIVSVNIIPRSSIDTEFQYYLVPISGSDNRKKYEIFADMLSKGELVAITNAIRISSRSSLSRVFGISANRSKRVLVMTKLLEKKYVREIPDEAKFKRVLFDNAGEMLAEINQAKVKTYNANWRY